MAERRCEKKEKKVSHGGTATTAFLEEGEKCFGRCGRCVAVRKKEKRVSHGSTASTAFLEEVEKRFGRCGHCVAVRKKKKNVSHGGTETTAKGGDCKTSSGAVDVVSL